MSARDMFKPDRNQAIAVVAMIAAVFLFATGEIAFGVAAFAVAAVFSIGGLFWNAHRQDQADAAARKAATADATSGGDAMGTGTPPAARGTHTDQGST